LQSCGKLDEVWFFLYYDFLWHFFILNYLNLKIHHISSTIVKNWLKKLSLSEYIRTNQIDADQRGL
jgi:hypothetical protein